MQEILNHPAVQGGVAPFVVGLVATLLFAPARLAGLAAIAGFAVTVWLVGGFSFVPLTATRKIILVSLAAAVAGGAFMLAELPWVALPALALVPLAARIPLPAGLPVWGEAVLASVLGGIPAAAACFLVWQSSRGSVG